MILCLEAIREVQCPERVFDGNDDDGGTLQGGGHVAVQSAESERRYLSAVADIMLNGLLSKVWYGME